MRIFRVIESQGAQAVTLARRRAYAACLELLNRIKARTRDLCKAHQVFVRTIILSLPSNWDLDVEDHWRDLINQSLQPPRETKILFMTEIEANAHFVLNTRNIVALHLKERLREYGQFQCLFADFGGLTFVCIANIPTLLRNRLHSGFSTDCVAAKIANMDMLSNRARSSVSSLREMVKSITCRLQTQNLKVRSIA